MPVYENLVVTAFMQNNLFWAGKLQKQLERKHVSPLLVRRANVYLSTHFIHVYPVVPSRASYSSLLNKTITLY